MSRTGAETVFVGSRFLRFPATNSREPFQKGTKGLSPVAHRPFRLLIDLCHSAVEPRQMKQRIISEAAAPPRAGEDAALDCAMRSQHTGPILSSGQHATVAGTSLAIGNSGELLQQEEIVVRVGGGSSPKAGIGGVAGRANNGSALKKVD